MKTWPLTIGRVCWINGNCQHWLALICHTLAVARGPSFILRVFGRIYYQVMPHKSRVLPMLGCWTLRHSLDSLSSFWISVKLNKTRDRKCGRPGKSKLFHFTLQSNWTIDFKMIVILKQMKISFPNSCDKNKTNEMTKYGQSNSSFFVIWFFWFE